MPLSNCCFSPLYTNYGNEGTNCYICRTCKEPCDIDTEDVAEPVREEERLLGYDTGKEGGDETVALYGKRHEDGYVEVTKRVEGLWVGPTANSKPYVPELGDRVVLEGEVTEIEKERRLVVKIQPNAGEIYVYPKDVENGVLKLLSRKTRTLTKAEAEALLTEKLGESVRIEN